VPQRTRATKENLHFQETDRGRTLEISKERKEPLRQPGEKNKATPISTFPYWERPATPILAADWQS
jgi:hypothetical protein